MPLMTTDPQAWFMLAGLLIVIDLLSYRALLFVVFVERNFRGDMISQSYGMVILIWTSIVFGYFMQYAASTASIWLLTVVGFGGLGLLDDIRGDKRIKGLKGHFRAAFHEHKITTGFIKAIGGGLLALWIGFRMHPHNVGLILLAAGLIALSANAINLLDLRPGRAGAAFLVGAAMVLAIAAAVHAFVSVQWLLLVVISTLPVWWLDRNAKVMMGDVGSNLLGASLGLAIASTPLVGVQIAALALLIALHVLAERVSLTSLIANNRVLNTLDRLTGVR